MSEYVTHFLADHQAADDMSPVTMCGETVTSIVMTTRPATCGTCSDLHAAEGWTFPLPAVVTA